MSTPTTPIGPVDPVHETVHTPGSASRRARGIVPFQSKSVDSKALFEFGQRNAAIRRTSVRLTVSFFLMFLAEYELFIYEHWSSWYLDTAVRVVGYLMFAHALIAFIQLCRQRHATALQDLSPTERRLLGLPPLDSAAATVTPRRQSLSAARPPRPAPSPSYRSPTSRWTTSASPMSPMSPVTPAPTVTSSSSPINRLLDQNRITDKSSLERFLRKRSRLASTPSPLATPSPLTTRRRGGVNSTPLYAPSLRDAPADPADSDIDDLSDLALREAAMNDLRREHLGVTLELHAERLRSFLSSEVVQMLAAELRDSDAALLQWRNELLQQQTQLGAAGAAAVAALSAATTPARIYKLLLQATDSTTMQIVATRRQLQAYLTVMRPHDPTSTFPVSYVRERVERLASSAFMSEYKWDGGGEWRGKSWDAVELPTDTQILLHLFLCFVDARVLSRGSFSSAHFVPFSETRAGRPPSKHSAATTIVQTRTNPPNFVLRVIQAGSKPRVVHPMPGRNCLFLTLAYFVYFVHRHQAGIVCRTPLQSLGTSRAAQLALSPPNQ